MGLKYKKILLKLSGEALGGKQGIGLDPDMLEYTAKEIKKAYDNNIQIAITTGGGNIFRGGQFLNTYMPDVKGHLIGMEASTINALVITEMLKHFRLPAKPLSALGATRAYEEYTVAKAEQLLKQNTIVVCTGGTGNPFFSNDSAAVLRGLELGCDVVLKATKVDGVYSDDPTKNKDATKYDSISFHEAIEKNLRVMDQTAFILAKENSIPVVVFDMFQENAITDVIEGKKIGTIVS